MTTIEIRKHADRDTATLERELKQLEIAGAISFKDGKWHHNNKPKREYAIN